MLIVPDGSFVEINAPTAFEFRRDWLLMEYQNLLNFLDNSKNIDRKKLFGKVGCGEFKQQDSITGTSWRFRGTSSYRATSSYHRWKTTSSATRARSSTSCCRPSTKTGSTASTS